MGGTFGIVFVWWPLTIYYDDNGTRVPAATSDVTLANDMQEYILSFSAGVVPADQWLDEQFWPQP